MIAENFKAIQDKYGKEALWIQFSTEASQRFPPLLASVLGAQAGGLNGYDMGQGNGQIMAFSPWIGMFAQNTMWEWPEANVVILANTNLVETSLTWSRGMLDAQEAGTKFICLDPRFSPTAGKADQWVNLRAGTDPAFFLGMTKYILDEELFDREHVLAHTALPFLIDAETGACLADVVKGDAIHGAMFFGDIPTQKAANWNKTLEWLDSLDFVCLADIYHSSVTDFVDLVLPVCSKFECADSVGGIKCANAHILANLKVLDPLFESKSDFYIEKGIAEAMGLGDLFPADGEEYARALLTTDDPQMAGFTLEKLQEAGGALRLIGSEDLIAPEVGFTYGTASGRQEPYYEALLEFGQAFPAWEAPCEAYPENPLREKYPLQFNQARSRFRVHSAYSGAKWIQEVAEPHIELNPADAATRGLEDGDAVEVFNDRGSFRTVLRVNEAVRPESAFMVESTYRQYLDGTIMQSVSNDTLNPRGYALPFGPMIPYNDTLIEIKEVGE